jgi:hypothetical protein
MSCWRRRAVVWAGTLAVGLAASLTPTDSPARAQPGVDAIEYGISLGLPRAWAWRVAWCESRYDPLAYNRRSGAAGLYQFLPSTWRATPQGRAGLSPFDPYANAAAAAWLYRTAGPGQWSCR